MDAAADASPILRTVKVNELVNKPDLSYSYLWSFLQLLNHRYYFFLFSYPITTVTLLLLLFPSKASMVSIFFIEDL